MSISTGQAQLHEALKLFRHQWQETRSRWKDGVAQDFEEQYWNVVEAGTTTTLMAMDRLGQVLHQIRHDCSKDGAEYDYDDV